MKKRIRKHRLVEPEYNEMEVIEAIIKERLKDGRIQRKCTHCEDGILEFVNGCQPYTIDHLQCPTCDSTYNL